MPIKDFARAKSRLGTTLTAEQCAQLAACMAADVITALQGCTSISHIVCLGEGPEIQAFATEHGCAFITEQSDAGLSANLDLAAQQLQDKGAQTLLIVPGDLPTITPADIDKLLNNHHGGLTVCPAVRDGGTNALVVSPPTGIGFLFGEQSCKQHIRAAETAGLKNRVVQVAAFDYDIDRPVDLEWLCNDEPHGQTRRYLERSELCCLFDQPPSAASA